MKSNNTIKYKNIIEKKFTLLRNSFGVLSCVHNLFRLAFIFFVLLFFVVIIEGFRYFSVDSRTLIFNFFLISGIFILIFCFILFLLIKANYFKRYNNENLAKSIEKFYPETRDTLLNGLQIIGLISSNKKGFSHSLARQALENLINEIQNKDFMKIVPWKKIRKSAIYLSLIIVLFISSLFVLPDYFKQSFFRLLQPKVKFHVPMPFSISSINKNIEILGGDTTRISFQCLGNYPEKISLDLNYPDYSDLFLLDVDSSGKAEHILNGVRKDIVYEGFVKNNSIFKPWNRISSGFDTIFVINRPEILKVRITLDYPNYSKLDREIKNVNNTELHVFPGTKVSLKITSDQLLQTAIIKMSDQTMKILNITGNQAEGAFIAMEDSHFHILISNRNKISNIEPVTYRIRISPDSYPNISLINPSKDIALSESMEIPISVLISDDFGFSKALISYKINKKYSTETNKSQTQIFPILDKSITLQELFYNWNLEHLGLGPEDGIEFRIDIFDNDNISGPKKSSSRTISAYFPSLNELFSSVNEQSDEMLDEGKEILNEIESTSKELIEISRELLKNPQMKWEQKAQLEKQIQKTKKAGEKLENISKKLNKFLDEGKKNQLFNPEVLKKYAKLQEAFRNIMTPELKEAMEKLQKALEKMDLKEIKKSLDNFQTSQDQFSKELDRMLKLFKRVKIEQTISELAKRFEDLAKRQNKVDKELGKTSKENQKKLNTLSKQEKSIKQDTEIAKDIMSRIKKDMVDFPIMPDEKLQQLINKMEEMGLMEDLQKAQSELEKGNKPKASPPSSRSKENLESMMKMMQEFQENFNKQTMNEITNDFKKIINKTLQLSQKQEAMRNTINNTPRQSESLMDVAVEQQNIHQNLANIIEELISLSTKTFGVAPSLGKQFGKASSNMQQAISQMEERNIPGASQKAQLATESLNSSAMELMKSMENLEKSGSPSGFENYMKQLQKMAGQQQGLNQNSMDMSMGKPVLGKNGRKMSLQQMAGRQRQIRESLENLQKEIQSGNPRQSGNLGGIAKEMDEVIKDFNNNKILRKTIERQQKILSRLLDAQKSLRTQSYKKERISKVGEDIYRISPGDLPSNLGERKTYLQEKLEKALENKYSKEYEEIIRRYFESLSQQGEN